MSVEKKDLKRIFELSKLDHTKSDGLEKDIERLVESFSQIRNIDLKDCEPMVLPKWCILRYRKDEPLEGTKKSDALSQAPKTDGTFYIVPKIISGEP